MKTASFYKTTTHLQWPIKGLYLVTRHFSCLFTVFRKKNFLIRTTPTHFKFFECSKVNFAIFEHFYYLVNREPFFCYIWVPTESTKERNALIFGLKIVMLV